MQGKELSLKQDHTGMLTLNSQPHLNVATTIL